jgi:hypothetical protein
MSVVVLSCQLFWDDFMWDLQDLKNGWFNSVSMDEFKRKWREEKTGGRGWKMKERERERETPIRLELDWPLLTWAGFAYFRGSNQGRWSYVAPELSSEFWPPVLSLGRWNLNYWFRTMSRCSYFRIWRETYKNYIFNSGSFKF